ncbi:HTH_Tnp_Tc3_2 domain-containing protein [Trichonephila clavipes]|nr:HTH_Tnp_Tc3_2 domain-containing protein [Trichonephila clavipes]
MRPYSKGPTRVPLLTKRHCQLRLQCAWKHRDRTQKKWKRVAWLDKSRFFFRRVDGRVTEGRFQGKNCSLCVQRVIHRLVVAVLYFENILMEGPGAFSCGRKHHDSCGLSERNCGSVASLYGVCLPTEN